MTIVALVLGGAAAALGTRLCALGFVAAAVLGARIEQPVVAAMSTWTAATAAGWVLLDDGSPRRIAAPVLGAAAVLAAAGSPNGAVVLGLWVLGTASVVLTRPPTPAGSRWALGLFAGDVILAAAIATTAHRGFEGWPATLRLPGAIAVLAAATLRMPLAAGPAGGPSAPALFVVRAQTVLLLGLASAAADRPMLEGLVALGAVAFAAATTSPRRETVDAAQEMALAAMAIGGTALGWVPGGWVWGALAAGTLIHHLRFTLGRPPAGALVDAVGRAAGLGLPFLPVLLALLEGALRVSGWLRLVVLFGALGGLAGRSWLAVVPVRRTAARVDVVRSLAPLALVLVASVYAPVLSLPRPPGGGAALWPGALPALAILVVGAAGSQLRHVVTSAPDRADRTPFRALALPTARVDALAKDAVLLAGLGLLGAAAVGSWLLGLARGFL
jgi:hypothetical protein